MVVNIFNYRTKDSQARFQRMQTNKLQRKATLGKIMSVDQGPISLKPGSQGTIELNKVHTYNRRASKIAKFDSKIRISSQDSIDLQSQNPAIPSDNQSSDSEENKGDVSYMTDSDALDSMLSSFEDDEEERVQDIRDQDDEDEFSQSV
jgi:hypothetical protein